MLVRGEGAVGLNADPPVPPPKGGASGREAVAARKKLWKEQCCGREAVAAAWKELLLWSRTGEPGWPRIPPQGSRGAECETAPASGAEQAGKEGSNGEPPQQRGAGWETAPASEAVAVDEKLLPGQSGPAASRRLINHHRSAGEHQPPKLPATGVQQYDVGEPAEALQEGLQEAWNFKLFLYQNYCHFGPYS